MALESGAHLNIHNFICIQDRPTQLHQMVQATVTKEKHKFVCSTGVIGQLEALLPESCKVTLYHPKILLKKVPTPCATFATNLPTADDKSIRIIQQTNRVYLAQPW